jgi:uncharacterized protein with HEPN domain
LQHILDAIEKISSYASTQTYEQFTNDEWSQDALVRNLEIIGEAANNIDPSIRSSYSGIPWREIIDFRNVVAHDYADLDLRVVWNIVTTDLPQLRSQISKMYEEMKK